MRLLLDTHTLLWFLHGDARLSAKARTMIEDMSNERFTSVASLWEIAIKVSVGKFDLGSDFEDAFPAQLDANRIELLPVRIEHLSAVAALPLHHRDPFDRLIIAQAQVEGMPVVGADPAFDAYGVQRLW